MKRTVLLPSLNREESERGGKHKSVVLYFFSWIPQVTLFLLGSGENLPPGEKSWLFFLDFMTVKNILQVGAGCNQCRIDPKLSPEVRGWP